MAIVNDDQLELAFEQVRRLHRAMATLKRQTSNNARNFALLAEGPIGQLEAIQAEIAQYTGLAALREDQAELWLRIEGNSVGWREASTSVTTAILDALRKGVQAVTEVVATGGLGARPTAELKRACDLQLVAIAPGSLRVGLRLPVVDQQLTMDPKHVSVLASEALDTFLRVATWASSPDSTAGIDELGLDESLQRTALTQLLRLVPRQRGDVDLVELSGRRIRTSKAIKLLRSTRTRISEAIDRSAVERLEVHEGIVREIDLDKRSFILRHPDIPTELRCEFEEDLLDTAITALDRFVEVSGTRSVAPHRRSAGQLKVSRIDVVDESDDERPD
jgi:hypothetical protein